MREVEESDAPRSPTIRKFRIVGREGARRRGAREIPAGGGGEIESSSNYPEIPDRSPGRYTSAGPAGVEGSDGVCGNRSSEDVAQIIDYA